MQTVLLIRVNSEDANCEYFNQKLQQDLPKLTGNQKLESLILRDADNRKFQYVSGLNFKVLAESDKVVINFKKNILQMNGDFFLLLDFDLSKNYDLTSIEYMVESILERFVLLLNLSYNFPIDFLESITFNEKDEVINISKVIISDLNFAYKHSERVKWPELANVDITDVMESFKFNNYSMEGVSKNDFQRAVNAFSHNFCNLADKSSDILFWNMVGIESLLAKGNKDIQSQIREKSSLILGEPVEFKKKLNKLYEFRSKFIHGELNFPLKFSSDEKLFEEEYWDYTSFSASILLSLIRHLVTHKKYQFDFEYTYLK